MGSVVTRNGKILENGEDAGVQIFIAVEIPISRWLSFLAPKVWSGVVFSFFWGRGGLGKIGDVAWWDYTQAPTIPTRACIVVIAAVLPIKFSFVLTLLPF